MDMTIRNSGHQSAVTGIDPFALIIGKLFRGRDVRDRITFYQDGVIFQQVTGTIEDVAAAV